MTSYSAEQLQTLNQQFEREAPQDILRWVVEEFGAKAAVVTSFQPTGIVTLHMLSEMAPDTPVLTLDTGLLFPETYALMDTLEAQLGLNLTRIHPEQTVEQQAAAYGSALWERNPDQCCGLRKTAPLEKELVNYSAWITGLRRDQSDRRADTSIVAWDSRHRNIKVAPFATWDESMIWTYIHAYELPYNALHEQGYPSIGCYPCTSPAAPGSTDKRDGRWVGHAKTECGIHVPDLNPSTKLTESETSQ